MGKVLVYEWFRAHGVEFLKRLSSTSRVCDYHFETTY